MSEILSKVVKPSLSMVTFFHDIEQNIDNKADPLECRQIVKEFLNLEKSYGISTTYNVVGKLFNEQPDLIEWIIQDGQEVAFHSYNHYSDWQPKYYADEINLCAKVTSIPNGYRSPQSSWNQTTLNTLEKNGFIWNAENDRSKEPYYIYKSLVRLPVAGDDWLLHTGRMNINEWIQHFRNLFKSHSYIAFGSHDFVASLAPEERLKAWESLLQIAIENEALFVNFSEAADLFKRAALNYYNKVKYGNPRTKTYYDKIGFHKQNGTEANGLSQSVVANIDSNARLPLLHLNDFTKKKYLVNNLSVNNKAIPVTAFNFSFPRHQNILIQIFILTLGRYTHKIIFRLRKWILNN